MEYAEELLVVFHVEAHALVFYVIGDLGATLTP
jgi:hypothetical protein